MPKNINQLIKDDPATRRIARRGYAAEALDLAKAIGKHIKVADDDTKKAHDRNLAAELLLDTERKLQAAIARFRDNMPEDGQTSIFDQGDES